MYSCFNAAADGGTGIAQAGNYVSVSRGAFGGTWFAKLYASAKLVPWYKVTLQGLYIGDTTKNGNTFGTARAIGAGSPRLKDYDYIGTEADVIGEWQLYKNLKFTAAYGFMWAGPAMKLWSGTSNHMIQNPWQLTTNLTYSF